eukprot:7278497-Lingulodinium_polyedra.AAC.1
MDIDPRDLVPHQCAATDCGLPIQREVLVWGILVIWGAVACAPEAEFAWGVPSTRKSASSVVARSSGAHDQDLLA